jgi:hypothetical protein
LKVPTSEELLRRFHCWLDTPVPTLRVELLRIGAPLAILGFMSERVAHADEWLGETGFRVPDLGGKSSAQPLFVPALPNGLAWAVAAILVVSGLLVAAGVRPKIAAAVFAVVLAFVGLSDRLAAFTVAKLSPTLALTIALSPCGRRWGVDAWLAHRKDPGAERETHLASGSVRFIQILLPVIYSASGIAKMRGDWITNPYVLWAQLHDSFQTDVTFFLANHLPKKAWIGFSALTLAFEVLAPLWFAFRRTRIVGLALGVGMHAMIGAMFGPVRYFALLMISLLVAAYTPASILERVLLWRPRTPLA